MRKAIIIIILLLLAAGAYWGYGYYRKVFLPNVALEQDFELLIHSGAGFEAVMDSLAKNGVLKDMKGFKWVAHKKDYPERIRPGRFLVKPGMSNNELVNKLRSGAQDPVRLVLHDVSGVYELAGKLSRKLEPDSTEFLVFLNSKEKLEPYEVDPYTVTAYFLPNTYEMYWNLTAEQVMSRMRDEFYRFWTDERLKKAREMELSPIEV
ncbi:MAG: endolytic transglycosylase MltG, partial [Owenweeksia sp.]